MWAFKIFVLEFLLTIIMAAIIYGVWRATNPGQKW